MKLPAIFLIPAWFLFGAGGFAKAEDLFTVKDLGTLGGSSSYALGIDSLGRPIGYSLISGDVDSHAFRYEGGVMKDLGTLGGGSSYANAVNSQGQVVGFSYLAGNLVYSAFRDDGGGMINLGTFGGTKSTAYGINALGHVVGRAAKMGDTVLLAFRHKGGAAMMEDLGTLGGTTSAANAINTVGQIVGKSDINGDVATVAFLYDETQPVKMQSLGVLQGGNGSEAMAINSLGEVVGESFTAGNTKPNAFLSKGAALIGLGTLGGTTSRATHITDEGTILGESTIAGDGVTHAFIYRDNVMTDLNTLIPAASGWVINSAFSTNRQGQIVGWGTIGGQTRACVLTAVPPGGAVAQNNYTLQSAAFNANVRLVTVSELNATGEMAGTSMTKSRSTAFHWKAGQLTTLLPVGATNSWGFQLDAKGAVFGATKIGGVTHATRWSGGDVVDLTPDGSITYSISQAVNDSGQTAGNFTFENVDNAFTWQDGTFFADLSKQAGITRSYAWDVNAAGVICGSYQTGDAASPPYACLWKNHLLQSIHPQSGALSSVAYDVNDGGYVAGAFDDADDMLTHAFVRSPDGTLQDIHPQGGASSQAYRIAENGRVMGTFQPNVNSGGHVFTWHGGKFDDLHPTGVVSLSAHMELRLGRISGSYQNPSDGRTHAFAWIDGTFMDLNPPTGTLGSKALAVNSTGRVVGFWLDPLGAPRACTWKDGVRIDLGPKGSTSSQAVAINEAGQIAIIYTDGSDIRCLGLLTPAPTNQAAPGVKISGKKRVMTTKASLRVKGTATGAVTAVTLKNGKRIVGVAGTASWSAKVKLKPGKNRITVTASGPGGTSAPARVTVIRK